MLLLSKLLPDTDLDRTRGVGEGYTPVTLNLLGSQLAPVQIYVLLVRLGKSACLLVCIHVRACMCAYLYTKKWLTGKLGKLPYVPSYKYHMKTAHLIIVHGSFALSTFPKFWWFLHTFADMQVPTNSIFPLSVLWNIQRPPTNEHLWSPLVGYPTGE